MIRIVICLFLVLIPAQLIAMNSDEGFGNNNARLGHSKMWCHWLCEKNSSRARAELEYRIVSQKLYSDFCKKLCSNSTNYPPFPPHNFTITLVSLTPPTNTSPAIMYSDSVRPDTMPSATTFVLKHPLPGQRNSDSIKDTKDTSVLDFLTIVTYNDIREPKSEILKKPNYYLRDENLEKPKDYKSQISTESFVKNNLN